MRNKINTSCEYCTENIDYDNSGRRYFSCERNGQILAEENPVCDDCIFSLLDRIRTIVKESDHL
ncbi:MAG: hypothetical protein ACI4QE_02745 [Acutalibacteraceae bacterium]